MELIFGYFGVDWAAMALTCPSLHCFGTKKRAGFVFGMLSNVAWFSFGVMAASLANPVANIVFFSLNLRGYLRWGTELSA
jgi:hypothetical protein